jgi:hypothetical protein
MAGMAKLIVGTTIAGYISLTIKDLVKGKTPRDLQEKPGEILVASMLQGGALGLFGDFFFADMRNRYGNGPVTTILGPAASVTESFVDLFHQAIRGDNVNTELLKILKNNTPGGNLPFVGLALNHFVFWDLSNQISPGYMSRMQSRMQSEYGQELWIPGR